MRKKYDSDISREQFAKILPLLQSVRWRTKPTTVELYEVFSAVLKGALQAMHRCKDNLGKV